MARRAVTIATITAVVVLVLAVASLLRPGSTALGVSSASIAATGPATQSTPATSSTSSTGKAEDQKPIPETGKTEVKSAAAVAAVCAVQPTEVADLTEITPNQTIDSLRDAIPLLQDRLDQVTSAAVGRPALKPVVAQLERISTFWEQAVAASDTQHPAAVKKALASANRRITGLKADLQKAYPGNASGC